MQGRKQRIAVNGTLSDIRSVKSGVPQGSILGPLLIVLFINSMQNRVSPGTQIALYADDTKIWRRIVTPNDHKILQNDINALFQWSIENSGAESTLKVGGVFQHFSYFFANFRKWGV